MPLKTVNVEIRWDEGVRNVSPLDEEEASSTDGLMLNHEYSDYRGYDVDDAIEAVEEEAELLAALEAADWDTDEAEEVIEAYMGAMGLTSGLDAGVAGLVYAISALGGTPISSCNGAVVGISSHKSDVPHVLFTAPAEVMDRILAVAPQHRVGIIRNECYAEAFTDRLPNLHTLAKTLVGLT